ncbi:anaerobic ribonucleoside-triphosphate reductase activating protein [Fusobacterium perfoetens]|uniref:anaerobic ribonucleoside-triphosphate reductase activating protein n=1 Tax=Fusobacterium perfoetens TaxID=852 RepID=UPI00047F63E4|nr:anaerobic ribonucleoside-triphosphate reductase activating protein [Fusobacterium perfoetens]MCI6152304.1 anaerobic ribonucleoside-triphosphate reductase activating protein [Fusobacterium perfoetens]MDY3238162.1 anaerobic ribonucleoside-triphosphate reductase activating protein [Fusobacterium perfoetens]
MKIISIVENDPINSMTGFTLTFYFAGCDHYCKGCFSQNTWDYESGQEYEIEDIKELILNSRWKNVTFLGGDPFYFKNREEVIELIYFIKKNTSKNIYLWTGYTIEEIQEWIDPSIIDYLIEGRFEIDRKDLRLKLRGSSNQRVFHKGIEMKDIDKIN